MAQQKGAIRFTGKLANTVGFKNMASLKKNKFFVREHVDEVLNPQTARQAAQRAKAKPAQMFYQAFEAIENHAYLPLGRASRNRNRFLSLAMKLQAVPDVPKGYSFIPTLPYRISEGSLGIDSIAIGSESSAAAIVSSTPKEEIVAFGLMIQDGAAVISKDNSHTIADWSGEILASNPLLTNGQELTFLAVLGNKSDISQRVSAHCSIVINTADSVTKVSDIASNLFTVDYNSSDQTCVSANDENWVILSAGLIISSKAGNTWRYTNSNMAESTYAKSHRAFTESEVLQSYMKEDANNTSELILQQADNTQGSGSVTIQSVSNVSFTGPTGTLNHNTAAVAVMSDGSRRVVVGDDGWGETNVLQYRSSVGNYEAITATVESVISAVHPANTSFGASPTINVAEVIAAGF